MDWLPHIISGVLMGLFFFYANQKSRETPDQLEDGKYHLRVNGFYKWAGYLGLGAGIFAFIGANLSGEEGIFLVSLFALVMFGGLGLVLLMWYRNHKVVFDEEMVRVKDWKGNEKVVEWEAIEEVKFRPLWGYLTLYSESKQLNLHMHLVGLGGLVHMMEEKTDFKAADLKLPFG